MAFDPRKVNRPTETPLGTVLIPFQDTKGRGFVVELTRAQYRSMHNDVRECFARIDRQAETAAALLSIDRHESVVG